VPILPELIKQFSGGDTSEASHWAGWLGAIYALMEFVFARLLGCLSDGVGRRPVILISQFGMALDYVLRTSAWPGAWGKRGPRIYPQPAAAARLFHSGKSEVSNEGCCVF